MDIVRKGLDLAQDHRQTRWIMPLLLVVEVALCGLIIWKVPYTEIDWRAYMQQVSQYVAGQRNYSKLYGDTGPLVYPAVHVYIYRALYGVTDHGKDIRLAQYIFGVLYIATLALVMACYRQAKVPPYVFPLLTVSKRLHSIFMLRLFNDCFAVFFLFVCIFCYQRGLWTAGSLAYSTGVGVKMSILLALPAVGIILLQALGRPGAIRNAVLMVQLQLLTAWPFATRHWKNYAFRAFEFSRVFLFKWTVNWRFVGEEVFLSQAFSIALLTVHANLLVLFAGTRWLGPSGMSIMENIKALFSPPPPQNQANIRARVSPRFILTTILTANVIGMLCARSLHYQFYALLAWSSPFLLWRAGLHPVLQYLIWGVQEIAWNIYPSTTASSLTVVTVLAFQVVAVWFATGKEDETGAAQKKKRHAE